MALIDIISVPSQENILDKPDGFFQRLQDGAELAKIYLQKICINKPIKACVHRVTQSVCATAITPSTLKYASFTFLFILMITMTTHAKATYSETGNVDKIRQLIMNQRSQR